MATDVPLPDPGDTAQLWSQLLGRAVAVHPATSPTVAYATATYITDDSHVVAVGLFDAKLAASLGAALILIPAGAAEDAAAERDFSDAISSSFQEVANITSSLFASLGVHVRLRETIWAPDDVPADAAAVIAAPSDLGHYSVTVAGYQGGAMSFLHA